MDDDNDKDTLKEVVNELVLISNNLEWHHYIELNIKIVEMSQIPSLLIIADNIRNMARKLAYSYNTYKGLANNTNKEDISMIKDLHNDEDCKYIQKTIAKLTQLCNECTPGPWTENIIDHGMHAIVPQDNIARNICLIKRPDDYPQERRAEIMGDIKFIERSRSAIPELINIIRKLEMEIETAKRFIYGKK